MASQTSLKELSKAINAYITEPTLPLPEELIETIAAYLRRHPKYEESAADRLQEELLSIFEKHVSGNLDASGAWIAILRRLLPMIQTPERLLLWMDTLQGILTQRVTHDRNVVDETVAGLMDLVALADDYQEDVGEGTSINPIVHTLFSSWMERFYPGVVEGIPNMEYNERMFREALIAFGKRRPLQFFASLDSFLVQAKHRQAALRFLCDFVQNRPPHLHQMLDCQLFGHLLSCLQQDTSTAVISSALTALTMLLPHMPSALVPFLPVLFNIYARLLFWKGGSAEGPELVIHNPETEAEWDVCSRVLDVDDTSIAHLANYYTVLYGLYPLNLMDYIRKPTRYLRHANIVNAEEFGIQATELRDQSERFRQCHLLHPNFYTLTVESEKTDLGRWIKSEAAQVVTECMALYISTDTAGFGPDHTMTLEGQLPSMAMERQKNARDSAILDSPPAHDALPKRALSTLSHRSLSRVDSQTSLTSRDEAEGRRSGLSVDNQSLTQSTSHTQLQDLIQSNKAIKSGMRQSTAESEPSAPASHHESGQEKPPTEPLNTTFFSAANAVGSVNSQLAHLQRQNLMLQNDLSFERYQKQQHIAHVGELRRRQVSEAATEAETQNLIIMNRNLKNRFEEAKKAEMQVRKESEKSRAMAKKWEADLSAKLKTLRDKSNQTNEELERVKRELKDTQGECEKLRKLVCIGEVKELNWKQNMQSAELQASETDRLEAEVERLTIAEREAQAQEQERLQQMEASAAAEARAESLSRRLAAEEFELQRARKLFEAQVRELHAQLSSAQRERRPRSGQKMELETLMAGSRAKQAEMQKQYDGLMRKYTALQSALFDMQSGATPEQIRMEASSHPMPSGDYPPRAAPGKVAQPARALSDAAIPDATSYNMTPPLRKESAPTSAAGQGQRPATPGGIEVLPTPTSPDQRYFGRGGVQNRIRKEGKAEEGSASGSRKKDKRSTGLRGLVRGRTE
ncbi:Tuberous sclerosis 1 protein-like protein [Emericellopsis cladophorae]|uniref:Tuberous sclerosis 1 protein-like protein n=1 Tax=Emericellopsis cladophorae TaxID=2686198 RepID=A0A9Q0BDH3_9HYPO|nr:Tuberous sclerosis 1 protein-like protein [Emericellopsis cladophorae]KAI6781387.1 Tuberous sclerosis 1 protein-like protein [Emericellopsis cladophorae]